MALYKVNFKPSVYKDIKSIPGVDREKIIKRMETLATNPRPLDCKKLSEQNKYRLRQGDYRILYTIDDRELKVGIIKVGHRKDIYKVSEEKERFMASNLKKKK